ncbi:MAG: DUF4276 family protein [Muribaculaceae bacterium]|nr:DUF4276 family protein [Muribaculaceae bacterium]
MVYAEGGTLDVNSNATTMNNVAALREELNRFMAEALGRDDIRIIVKLGGGYKNTAKEFAASPNETAYLYVDLDRLPEKRNEWFLDIAKDGIKISDKDKERVFFWVQEMEAWFLKQPQAIEAWAEEEDFPRKTGSAQPLSEHKSIKGRDIERLQQKPSVILNTILRQTYLSNELNKNNKQIDLRYGKLAHAPGIISHLSPKDLTKIDRELQAFITKVHKI